MRVGNLRSPRIGAYITCVTGEEPVVSFRVLHSVLQFAVGGFVQVFDDSGSCPLCARKVRLHIINKYSQALGSKAKVQRIAIARFRGVEHHPGVAQAHLSAREGVTIAIVLDESERLRQPFDRAGRSL